MASALVTALSLARVGVFLLGVLVAARAFGGYRRTGIRPLLYFAVAFALVSFKPVVAFLTGYFFSARTLGYVDVAADVVLFGAAFLVVLFALYRLE